MVKVHTENGYDFYYSGAVGDKQALYNIVPAGVVPAGGYYNMQVIENKKGVKFPDRYQPTKHGMRNLYMKGE